jgi:hypothetical protein
METKVCKKCGTDKTVAEFLKYKNNKPYAICRVCNCLRCKQYHIDNKLKDNADNRAASRRRRSSIREWIWRYKQAHPCVDCGEPDPIVLDFDHTDRANKCYNVSAMICANKSLASVQDEAAKCVVRCANCHRRKTWKETRQFAEQCQPIPKASGGAA